MDILWMAISWSVFGLIVGALARLLVPGRQSMGLVATMVLGIVGSFIGGFLGSLLFGGEITLRNPAGWIGGIIGAVIALLIFMRASRSRAV
jgi:uncharacterized membrane protein YeaQ/YmgE (transglycosylase-associated protein family)